MPQANPARVAIIYPGDRQIRQNASPDNNRFANLFQAFLERGVAVEPAVYHDDFSVEVYEQIVNMDAVLVWINPVVEGRDRTVLDAMLREVAKEGVFVSAHPDIILKLGTKEVLHNTRTLGWGCETHIYRSMTQLRAELPPRLADGQARVLKQYRGHSGEGIWKIQAAGAVTDEVQSDVAMPFSSESVVTVRHALRGSSEEQLTLEEFFRRCEKYFEKEGRLIEQAYQEGLTRGMIRCYLVHDTVAGFGHQAINALYPAPAGQPASAAPAPGQRLYYPPTKPGFQALKLQLENEWVPAMQKLLEIDSEQLPVLWDCDFLFGPPKSNGDDSYVLCEINVSSVAPFPESALAFIVDATLAGIH
jgi:hypothetical protein